MDRYKRYLRLLLRTIELKRGRKRNEKFKKSTTALVWCNFFSILQIAPTNADSLLACNVRYFRHSQPLQPWVVVG